MTAIVYVSNTGSSKQYAEMLSEKTGFPAFDFADADKVPADAEVVFIGWVMAGAVQGLKEARDFFTIKAVCPVGMMKSEKQDAELKACASELDRGSLRRIVSELCRCGVDLNDKIRGASDRGFGSDGNTRDLSSDLLAHEGLDAVVVKVNNLLLDLLRIELLHSAYDLATCKFLDKESSTLSGILHNERVCSTLITERCICLETMSL